MINDQINLISDVLCVKDHNVIFYYNSTSMISKKEIKIKMRFKNKHKMLFLMNRTSPVSFVQELK